MMESSPTPIHPSLSRAHKSQPYLAARKRKRPSDGDASFEVRPSPRGGVGIFCTEHISCGDLIIAHEEPLVHCRVVNDFDAPGTACDLCSVPVGSLRGHVTGRLWREALSIAFPYLDARDDGLKFNESTAQAPCRCKKHAVWCCFQHMREGVAQHSVICGSPSLDEYYDSPMIFRLATQAVTLILQRMAKLPEQQRSPIEQFYFWRDYGSHPLWWEMGSAREEKKRTAAEFVEILTNALLLSRRRYMLQEETSHMWLWLGIDEALIREICSLENAGHILGVLQCNVMEYEYSSPRQQYAEHFEEAILEYSGEDNAEGFDADDAEDPDADGIKAGCKWLLDNVLNSATVSDGEEESNPALAPIKGSGLYPLLTLANHDCNPNASIEFLQESNRGSMVATRDIAVGEEIFITYVPNGGVGGGDGPEYFRHFEPTRTWKWLNEEDEDESADGSAESNDDKENAETADEDGGVDSNSSGGDEISFDEREREGEEELPMEGSGQSERAKALLEFGFECKCQRCLSEQKQAPAEE
ncbi:hypothetical protein ACHAXT_007195 [Thalassiosira profunda]